MKNILRIIFACFVYTMLSHSAYAACTAPAGAEGNVIYNTTHKTMQFCDGTDWRSMKCSDGPSVGPSCTAPVGMEGDMIYNTTHNVMQFCDGSDWWSMKCSGAAPVDCTTGPIGTRCTSDGAIYAGDTVGGARMYAAACDHGMTWDGSTCTGTYIGRQWKTSNTSTAGTASVIDGVANTDAIAVAGIASHPAAQACRAIGTEWYLPARDELKLLYDNLVDQNGDNTPGGPIPNDFGFGSSFILYLSSTNNVSGAANFQRFTDGFMGDYGQMIASSYSVRCVRR